MGIKDINKTLKQICPEAFLEIPMSKFKGKAVGIDASLWMFKNKSSAMKDVLRIKKDPLKALDPQELIDSMIKLFYGFIYKLCQFGVTPVWIFDGKTHPAKIATDKRKKVRSQKRITLEEERDRLENMDPLERVEELDKFIRGMLGCICFTKDEENALKNEIRSLGIPMFEAPYDAEIYAAAMSRKQLLLGVWTTDTDAYAAGALSTMTGFSKGYSKEGVKVEIVVTPIILDKLGISQEQFRDFCIMHECDFNQRIPKLGPAGILNKMEQYDWNLDKIIEENPDIDWSLLNLNECREIFNGPDISNITLQDLIIDEIKWVTHMRSKVFDIDLPPRPEIVELI